MTINNEENKYSYEKDVFISWTGKDFALKDRIKGELIKKGLSCYDSSVDCYGDFRENYTSALRHSKVYLVLLTDNIRSNGDYFTEVRREIDVATDLEARGLLNILVFTTSDYFNFSYLPDENDDVGTYVYNNLNLFKKSAIRCGYSNGDSEKITDSDIAKAASDCLRFVEKRDEGNPAPSFNPRIPLEKQNLTVSEGFIGREDVFNEITSSFESGKQIVILSGFGGIGKTEIAKNYAATHKEKFVCPQIISISDREKNEFGLRNIVFSANFNMETEAQLNSCNRDEQYRRKLGYLKELGENILLVVDNYNILTEYNIEDILLELNCKVLITTRLSQIKSSEVSHIRISELPKDEAKMLFKKHYQAESYTDEEEEQIDLILEKIVRHTMMIPLIAKQMREHSLTIAQQLNKMNNLSSMEEEVEFKHNLYGESAPVIKHLKELFNAYGLFDTVDNSPNKDIGTMQTILRNMSLCYYGGVPETEFKRIIGLNTSNELIKLERYGLLFREKRVTAFSNQDVEEIALYLHPLVSLVCSVEFSPDTENCKPFITFMIDWLNKDNGLDFSTTDEKRRYAEFMAETLYQNHSYSSELNKCYVELLFKLGNAEVVISEIDKLAEKTKEMPQAEAEALSLKALSVQVRYETKGSVDAETLKRATINLVDKEPMLAAKYAVTVLKMTQSQGGNMDEALRWAIPIVYKCDDLFVFSSIYSAFIGFDKSGIFNKYLKSLLKKHKKDKENDGGYYYTKLMQFVLSILGLNKNNKRGQAGPIERIKSLLTLSSRNTFLLYAMYLPIMRLCRKLAKTQGLYATLANAVINSDELDFYVLFKTMAKEMVAYYYDVGYLSMNWEIFSALEAYSYVAKSLVSIKGMDEETKKRLSQEVNKQQTNIDSSSSLIILDSLCETFEIIGEFDHAIICVIKKLDILKNNYPPYHLDVAKTYEKLSELHTNLVKDKSRAMNNAITCKIEALRIYEKTIAPSLNYYTKLLEYCELVINNPNNDEFLVTKKQEDSVLHYGLFEALELVLDYSSKEYESLYKSALLLKAKAFLAFKKEGFASVWQQYVEWVREHSDNKRPYRRKKVLKEADGSRYKGELRYGLKDGKGKITYSASSWYEGEFSVGFIHGIGVLRFESGDCYEGSFMISQPNGYGKSYYETGAINYDGEWKNSNRDGYGKQYDEEGNLNYEGEWKNNAKNGKGKYIYSNGTIYYGEWKNNNIDGYGKLFKVEGNLYYVGEFENDAKNGKGKYIYRNGMIYDGEWKNGNREGYGKQYDEEGILICEGEFKNNALYNGKGKLIYKDGKIYDGEWKNGIRDGYGKLYNAEGILICEGEFKYNALYNGKGKLIYKDGKIYDGEWKNGKRDGYGKLYNAEGALYYEGEFKNDAISGKGKYIYSDGTIYVGEFKNAKREGSGRLYDADGLIIYDGIWANDQKKE